MNKTTEKKTKSAFLLERAIGVASFYGFKPYQESILYGQRAPAANAAYTPVAAYRSVDERRRQCTVLDEYLLRSGKTQEPLKEPQLIYYVTRPRHQGKKLIPATLTLEVFGIATSVGEALVLRTAISILYETSATAVTLSLNSIGDRETMLRFIRECSVYYRKRIHDLHAPCRELLRKNIWNIFSCSAEKCILIRKEGPQPVSFLSERSRAHFKQVLEFLETIGAPYDIDSALLPDTNTFSETIFEIRSQADATPGPQTGDQGAPQERMLAFGGRYNYLARKIGLKRDVAAVGISLPLPEEMVALPTLHPPPKRKPKVYFIQLGLEAVRKSFPVLEILREKKVPLLSTPGVVQLLGQLSVAEKLSIPYTIIIGQREAVDGTVIVRHTETRKQETVPVRDLSAYLQKIKL